MSLSDQIKGMEWLLLEPRGVVNTKKHQECGICGKKDKLRFSDYNGRLSYICVCGSGDVIRYISELESKPIGIVCAEIRKELNIYDDNVKPITPVSTKISPILNSSVDGYLTSRGISIRPKMAVGYQSSKYHIETKRHLESMQSILSDHKMDPCYEHYTFLDGLKKVNQCPRKLSSLNSSNKNVSVKMFDLDTSLGIGEGIETSLSASQIYSIPSWAAINTSFLKTFRAPFGVKTLFVWADNDNCGAGLEAAFACGKGNILSKNSVNRVVVRWSERGDFNDHLNNPGRTFEWELSK